MNILITGAFGFVGSNLSKRLSQYQLNGLDLHETNLHIFNNYYSWNQFERLSDSNVDTVIHLTGKAHDDRIAADQDINISISM